MAIDQLEFKEFFEAEENLIVNQIIIYHIGKGEEKPIPAIRGYDVILLLGLAFILTLGMIMLRIKTQK